MDEMNLQGLKARQISMYRMFEDIAKKYGPWDRGTKADGAHYVEKSPFEAEGMICGNCAFFVGGAQCEIVEGEIAPTAICKLWVIKESLIKEAKSDDASPAESASEE